MATKYIEVQNDSQKVVIDDNDKRLVLLRCGLLTSSEINAQYSQGNFDWPGADWYPDASKRMQKYGIFQITLQPNEKMLAFRFVQEDSTMAVGVDRTSENIYRIVIYTNSSSALIESILAKKIAIYIYGESAQNTDKYGLQIFNANGVSIFKSNDYLLKMLERWKYTYDFYHVRFDNLPDTIDIAANGDNKAVICNAQLANWTESERSADFPYPTVYGISCSDGKLKLKLMVAYLFSDFYLVTGGFCVLADYLFADVTNAPFVG